MRSGIRIVLLFLLLLLPAGFAAAERQLAASCPSVGADQVVWQKNKAGYYLCLPGGWDASAVTLTSEGSDRLYFGEDRVEVALDKPADLRPFLGVRMPVFAGDGKGMGKLIIVQGSPVTSLFFHVDEKEFRAITGNRDKKLTSGQVTAVEGDGSVSCGGELRQMRGRGNDSFTYPKKSYEFKLEEKASLAGIEQDRTWILLANYADVSMLRNQITLDLCREIGLPFSVKCAPADVWVNGEYLGLYLLTEKIQIKKHRVNITNLEEATEAVNDEPPDTYPQVYIKDGPLPFMHGYEIPNDPEDITGGYLITFEKPYRMGKYGYPGVGTADNTYLHIKEPTSPSVAQVRYLADLFAHVHDAVYAEDGRDPATGKHYSEYLDVSSFAMKFLVDNLSKNHDVVAGSQYMFKDSDSADPLLYAGPAWDYDISYGNAYRYTSAVNVFYALRPDKKNFYATLGKHEDFQRLLREKWAEALRPALAILNGETEGGEDHVLRSFAAYRDGIALSAAMNELRRGKGTPMSTDAGNNFTDGAAYLGDWIVQRTAFLDALYSGENDGVPAEAETEEE